MSEPYHKYVFDVNKRRFVGEFEEMYASEEQEGFDSWHQNDLMALPKQISQMMCKKYTAQNILDIGCGKGAFTTLLKTNENYVLGVDLSKTAVKKAKSAYPDVEFSSMTANEALDIDRKWDLVVMMEILSYLEDWDSVIRKISCTTHYFHLSLYLPDNPIGFVKSYQDLHNSFTQYFEIDTEIVMDQECFFLLGRTKHSK